MKNNDLNSRVVLFDNKIYYDLGMTKSKPLNILDLFCGCGGMTKGLYDAGHSIIGAIDIWDKAIESYRQNFEHESFIRDLTTFPPEEYDRLRKNKSSIDVLVGGPPCQGFSIAGKRDKNDPRNSLFMEYVKYLNFFRPKAFIMENVMGILSMKTAEEESVIDIITSYFTNDYDYRICKLYASDYEVPQNRRRVIIIGFRKDIQKHPPFPKPPIKQLHDRIPVRSVLLPIDSIEPKYFLSKRAMDGIMKKKQRSREEGKGFGAQFLNIDKPSYTIPARYWKDGYDALVKYNDTQIRRLTILELKRIQTFPDDFSIIGSRKDIIIQIGNAVPCKLAFNLGKYLMDNF